MQQCIQAIIPQLCALKKINYYIEAEKSSLQAQKEIKFLPINSSAFCASLLIVAEERVTGGTVASVILKIKIYTHVNLGMTGQLIVVLFFYHSWWWYATTVTKTTLG